jgi:hypothetical protein
MKLKKSFITLSAAVSRPTKGSLRAEVEPVNLDIWQRWNGWILPVKCSGQGGYPQNLLKDKTVSRINPNLLLKIICTTHEHYNC